MTTLEYWCLEWWNGWRGESGAWDFCKNFDNEQICLRAFDNAVEKQPNITYRAAKYTVNILREHRGKLDTTKK